MSFEGEYVVCDLMLVPECLGRIHLPLPGGCNGFGQSVDHKRVTDVHWAKLKDFKNGCPVCMVIPKYRSIIERDRALAKAREDQEKARHKRIEDRLRADAIKATNMSTAGNTLPPRNRLSWHMPLIRLVDEAMTDAPKEMASALWRAAQQVWRVDLLETPDLEKQRRKEKLVELNAIKEEYKKCP